MEGVNIIVYAFVTFALDTDGHFHVPAALPPGENPEPNERVAGWALEPVGRCWRRKKSHASLGNRTMFPTPPARSLLTALRTACRRAAIRM
jgi:hypothetical protein